MGDRILTAGIAQVLQEESEREGELLIWIVTGGEGEVVARPVTSGRDALPYVLMADTLEALRAQMPSGLTRASIPERSGWGAGDVVRGLNEG